MRRIDLHTHTFFSDGELVLSELVTRAEELGHEAIGVTDHVDSSNLDWVIERTVEGSEKLNETMDIRVIPGAELSYVPLSLIPELAKKAKEKGVEIVVVHGESIVEPVPPGTNIASLKCEDVDILGHPGMLTMEEAQYAAESGTYLEITSRDGHSLTNGRVARLALEAGAKLLINTDAHSPDDLITFEEAEAIGLGAGLEEDKLNEVLIDNPKELIG